MQNGYFQLVNYPDGYGYGVKLFQPRDGGEGIRLGELLEYLDGHKIGYDRKRIEMMLLDEDSEDKICRLGSDLCPEYPETYNLDVTADGMEVYVRFIAPSQGGRRMSTDEFIKDLNFKNITYGIRMDILQQHFQSDGIYCTDMLIAKGTEPRHGTDAKLEYLFNTEQHRKPPLREDGSVDYYSSTVINQCRKGDVLARIIPEDPGEPGSDVYGQPIKPRDVKRETLKFGRNIELSEDKLSIRSLVDGHVSLVDDKVFVADVFSVKNVDVTTGNLDYEGSIQVDGDVMANFEVKAGGNIIVNGLVEGAKIFAGGNIIIAKGMNGMGKGYLKAGGDVMVKFLENVRVVAGGFVEADAILHSRVSAGTEVRVEGRKGLIVGGYVQAGQKVTAKSIGASMGASTIVEVGVNPLIKTQYTRMQKLIAEQIKTIKNAEVILDNYKDKMQKGFQPNESQLKYIKSVAKLVEDKTAEMEQMNARMEKMRVMLDVQRMSEIVINDEIYPSTTIIIGDASKTLQTSYHYCKFVREQGEIKMSPL